MNLAYNLELISPEGKVVTTGKLSQASRYMGTSTTAATGGRGLAAGNYHVRIRGQNGDEDSVLLSVSEYDASLENQSLIPEEPMDNLNTEVEGNNENNLKFIKQVILEKKDQAVLLSVIRKDDAKYSVELKNPMAVKYINDLEIDEKTINTIEYSLSTWKNKVENLCYIKGWA